MKVNDNSEILLYSHKSSEPCVEVRLYGETIWLTQRQMSELFGVDSDTVGIHLRNIYNSNELLRKRTTEYYSVVRLEGKRKVKRKLQHYNLDAIISVGYRVNSKKGTIFRIWATNVLKEYLLKSYVLNKTKLKRQQDKIIELQNTVNIISNIVRRKKIFSDDTTALIKIIQDYTYALDLLDQYDCGTLKIKNVNNKEGFRLDYDKGKAIVKVLKTRFNGSEFFGREKDQSFRSSIQTIYQTFKGKDLYPSMEEKASNLLYFVIKNHSFVDGNKRIAAFIFLWFLEKNHVLYRKNGTKIIENNALVALTLMVAESQPREKEVMVKVITNLINRDN